MLLNRLEGKELISVTELRDPEDGEKRLETAFPSSAAPVLEDVEAAWRDFTAARLSGFRPEEREQYDRFAGKVRENIRKLLQ